MESARNESVMLHRRRHAWFCHVFPTSMMLFYIGAVFGLILNHCVDDTIAFNLENRLPIVKYGANGTYFGYSVAGHIVGKKDDAHTEKWLLVGAPLGQNLQPHTNHSGALFKCPITQNTNDCVQIITDGRRSSDDEEVKDLLEPLEEQEIKDGQWLGVTVRSQGIGGKILICAHRYITMEAAGESQYGQGLCYVLENDFTFDECYEPCRGRSTARAHEDYGYCQAGTSGILLEDSTMILGTPGPFTWRGTIFVISVGGEYLERDKMQYYGPHNDQNSPVEKYSYLGMAVTGGRYYGNQLSFASGAPRSNGNGQVLIFSKTYPNPSNPMTVTQIIDGEQFGSSFGYELITADINGDGLHDLIVAAPFYFTKTDGGAVYVYQNDNHRLPSNYSLKLTGKLESQFGLAMTNIGDINKDGCDDIAIGAPYEGNGLVYIYLGGKDGLSAKPAQTIASADLGLVTDKIQTFGSSLSGGIDVDGNSYPDLVIGAYRSSAVVTLLARPITNIKTEVRGSELTNIDPNRSGCSSNNYTALTCFAFLACCSISPFQSSRGKPLQLLYTIEAETFSNKKKFSRIFFGPNHVNRVNVVKRFIEVETNGRMNCQEEVVYIKENTRDIQSPIQFRLNYTIVEPTLPSSGLETLNPILDQTQADRTFQAIFQKDCGTDDLCQSQLEVYAEMKLNKDDDGSYTLILGQAEEIHLNVSVTNEQDSAYEAQLFVEHQPSVTYVAASKGQIICNRYNETVVACTLGNPLKRNAIAEVMLRFDPRALDDVEPQLLFKVFANTTSKQITPREKTTLAVKVVKKAELSIRGWALPEQSFYGGEVRNEKSIDFIEEIGNTVQHTYQIYNDGPWRVPFLNVRIQWPYQVGNDKQKKWLLYLEDKIILEGAGGGECTIDSINTLKLPKRPKLTDFSEQPAELMDYRSYIAKSNTNKSHSILAESSDKRAANVDKKESGSALNRFKRDDSMIVRAERLIDKNGKKTDIVNIDCDKGTAKCVTLHCKIYNMPSKSEAYVHVKARLWNSTLVEDYPRVDLVKIVSIAHISIPDIYDIQQTRRDDTIRVTTHAYPDLHDQPGDESIPIWIIIVSIVGGLLLLALFTYCLWRVGFFNRRRPDPTLSGNLEKNSENKQLLNRKR